MKNKIIRMLMCLMALVVAFTSAFAEETQQPETGRVSVLAVQGAQSGNLPSETAVLLAMLPEPGFDYVIFYDEGHLSVCDLTQTQTFAERSAAMDAWTQVYAKDTLRKASHLSLWSAIAEMEQDLSLVDVTWLPLTDLLPEQWDGMVADMSLLTACGGTLRLFATADMPVLTDKLAGFANVSVTTVTDAGYEVASLLLTEAGYLHVSDEATSAMMRLNEVQPATALPGQSVVIDRCATYQLVGSTYAFGSIAMGVTDEAQPNMAVLPITPAESAEAIVPEAAADAADTADVEAADVPDEPSVNVSASAVVMTQSEVSDQQPAEDPLDARLNGIAASHQLCWYLKPAPTLQLTLKADPSVVPFSLEDTISVTLTVESASELEKAQLCDVNLLDETGKYHLSAVLRSPAGAEESLALTAGDVPGVYHTTFARPDTGMYSIRATITRTDIAFSYPALNVNITVEAPAQITAVSSVEPIKLVFAPMLWHSGETQATLAMADYFGGAFTPVEVRSYNGDVVQLAQNGDAITLTALEEGVTQLFLMARDGQTSVVVPVEVTNGKQLVLLEGLCALIAVLVVVYTVLFSRMKQPRFRKGEQMSIAIDDGEAFALPLKSYRAGGVSLWRLLVISGKAADYKAISAELKHIVFLPKLDRVAVKADKEVSTMITGQTQRFDRGDHTFAVTLEAAEPEA